MATAVAERVSSFLDAASPENSLTDGQPDDWNGDVGSLKKSLQELLTLESRKKIEIILQEINKLTKIDRLLLYLELPSLKNVTPDPLRQPLNPLGSRSEIQLTITWIRTHLEEDPQVSLPKHEVYDEYLDYCHNNSIKPLSTADFGKVMKQVYPQVRPRRLGTRGNSRYCYAGLKKKVKLEDPFTPDCNANGVKKVANDLEDEVTFASSFLIREWVEKLLGVKFECLKDLAFYLLDKMYVDNRSGAAYTLLTTFAKTASAVSDVSKEFSSNDDLKHRETQNLLQKKLQERESMRDQKRRKEEYGEPSAQEEDHIMKSKISKLSIEHHGEHGANMNQNYSAQERLNDDPSDLPSVSMHSPIEQADPSSQPEPEPMIQDDPLDPTRSRMIQDAPYSTAFLDDNIMKEDDKDWATTAAYKEEKWDTDPPQSTELDLKPPTQPWDGQEPDEELNKYFPDNATGVESEGSKNDKLSQLRQLLEKNLKSPSTVSSAFKPTAKDWSIGNGNQSLSTRRRVSFNPLIVQDTSVAPQQQQSPNNTGNGRKRHFSFQPISPRQSSLPQSPSASPFISPRSTPVPMMRSRHSSGSAALPLHLLPQGQRTGFGSTGSDISRAATFGSASECSTPFISPHGTPIPFNRSRHNSAQGRLCRSRHSSGVGPAYNRYNMTPYSPMALNNLNNPYSPQPATPISQVGGEDPFQSGGLFAADTAEAMRSRHSSAESERSICSAPISPHEGVEIRQRHASAGHITVPQQQGFQFEHPMVSKSLVQTSTTGAGQGDLSYPIPGIIPQTTASGSFEGGFPAAASRADKVKKEMVQDDLDIALSALKDCDKDFSNFVQEVERNDK